MILVASSEAHCVSTGDAVWTAGPFAYAHWTPWLDHVPEVAVLARLAPLRAGEAPPEGWVRVDGPGVRVVGARAFRGRDRAWVGVPSLLASAWQAAGIARVGLLRSPGVVASALHLTLRARGVRWGVEVVGDPAESLAQAEPALRRLARPMALAMRHEVHGATAALYVTARTLQARYPVAPGRPSVAVPNAVLPDEAFDRPVAGGRRPGPVLDLRFVGTLSQPYKGLDVLLDALALTRWPHRLTVVGDGRLRGDFEARVDAAALRGRVTFAGAVPPMVVWDSLATADLFVLPSRTEGLPRALLEAMSVGLPCLATPVGGVPEVLPAEALVPVDDAGALAGAIDAVAADPGRRARMGAANRAAVTEFRASAADRVRAGFRRAVVAAAR